MGYVSNTVDAVCNMWQHTGIQVTIRVDEDRFKVELCSVRQLYYREPDLVKVRVPGSENRTMISPDGPFFIEFKTNKGQI